MKRDHYFSFASFQVKAPYNYPPFAAFDDLNQRYRIEPLQKQNQINELTTKEQEVDYHFSELIVSQCVSPCGEIEVFDELVIHAEEKTYSVVELDEGKIHRPKELELQPLPDNREWFKKLRPELQRRLSVAQNKGFEIDNFKIESTPFEERAAKVIEEYKEEFKERDSNYRVISATTYDPQGKILVFQGNELNATRKDKERELNPSKKSQTSQENRQRVTISGEIQITAGLALTPETLLEVFHEHMGSFVTDGRVWLQEGRYEISVEQMKGKLVAQLVNTRGDILGQGKISLNQISSKNFKNVALELTPYRRAYYGSIASAYGHLPAKEVHVETPFLDEEFKVNKEGQFLDRTFLRGSTSTFKWSHPKHWSHFVIGEFGQNQEVTLFPQTMISAFLKLSGHKENFSPEVEGIVWGQALTRGKTTSGVQVEVLGQPLLKPIYFNSLGIPDRNLKATSSNGLFAFVGLSKGYHFIKSRHKRERWPTQIAAVESGHISPIKIFPGKEEPILFRLFEAFSGGAVRGAISLSTGGEEHIIQGEQEIKVSVPSQFQDTFIHVDAGEYFEPVTIPMSAGSDSIDLPMISANWLKTVESHKKISIYPETGVVVGFIQGEDFEVYVEDQQEVSIVYFNAEGEVVSKGVRGGGFILFNAPVGFQNIAILSQSGQAYSRVMPSSLDSVSVFKYQFE